MELDLIAAFFAHGLEFTVRFVTKWGPPREWEEDGLEEGFLEQFTSNKKVQLGSSLLCRGFFSLLRHPRTRIDHRSCDADVELRCNAVVGCT